MSCLYRGLYQPGQPHSMAFRRASVGWRRFFLPAGIVCVLCIASCQKPAPKPLFPVSGSEELSDEEIRTPPERVLSSIVLENYEQISLGNIGALYDSLIKSRRVFLLGIRPKDQFVGVPKPGQKVDMRPYGDKLRQLSKNLETRVSVDGEIGWTFDEVSMRVAYRGREAAFPARTSTVFLRQDNEWLLVLLHQSYVWPDVLSQDIRAYWENQHTMKLPGLGSQSDTGLESRLQKVVERAHAGDSTVWQQQPAALWAHLAKRTEVRGPHNMQTPYTTSDIGNVTAAALGNVAWLATVGTVSFGAYTNVAMRGTYVFVRDGKQWKIAIAHEGAPIQQNHLDAIVFGKRIQKVD